MPFIYGSYTRCGLVYLGADMYKVAVQSILEDKKLVELSRNFVEFSILDKKIMSGGFVRVLAKVVLRNMSEQSSKISNMPFTKKADYCALGENTVLATFVFSPKDVQSLLLFSMDCSCLLRGMSVTGNIMTQKYYVLDKACFQKHLEKFKEHNKVVDVKYAEAVMGELTAKQHELVRTAYELGYFDYPRKVNLEKLAELMDVSKTTILETLRAAQKKVLVRYFEGDM